MSTVRPGSHLLVADLADGGGLADAVDPDEQPHVGAALGSRRSERSAPARRAFSCAFEQRRGAAPGSVMPCVLGLAAQLVEDAIVASTPDVGPDQRLLQLVPGVVVDGRARQDRAERAGERSRASPRRSRKLGRDQLGSGSGVGSVPARLGLASAARRSASTGRRVVEGRAASGPRRRRDRRAIDGASTAVGAGRAGPGGRGGGGPAGELRGAAATTSGRRRRAHHRARPASGADLTRAATSTITAVSMAGQPTAGPRRPAATREGGGGRCRAGRRHREGDGGWPSGPAASRRGGGRWPAGVADRGPVSGWWPRPGSPRTSQLGAVVAPRSRSTVARPGGVARMPETSSSKVRMGWPSTSVITSPSSRPACAAGLPATTWVDQGAGSPKAGSSPRTPR